MAHETNDQAGLRRERNGEAGVETLLTHASARPEPSAADREAVRAALEGEWRAVSKRRQWRARLAGVSVAAALVLVALIAIQRNGPVEMTELREVARVDRITGQVRVTGNQQETTTSRLEAQAPVFLGQRLSTGMGSGMALALPSGISLRVDEATELDLVGENSFELIAGRVYVDTGSARDRTRRPGSSAGFEILTSKGAVKHLGTQYMVVLNEEALAVSVREGIVQVISGQVQGPSALRVKAGTQLSLDETGETETRPADAFGAQWLWAEKLGTGFVLDSRTMAEFLEWVARETGQQLVYESKAAEDVAGETVLHGTVDLPAGEALDLILDTSDLVAVVEEGVIRVSLKP